MIHRTFKITAAAAFALAATPAFAQGPDSFLPGDGHDIVTKACVQCHGADVITATGKSREEWTTTVSTMVNNGAVVSEADFGKVVDYLAKSYPVK